MWWVRYSSSLTRAPTVAPSLDLLLHMREALLHGRPHTIPHLFRVACQHSQRLGAPVPTRAWNLALAAACTQRHVGEALVYVEAMHKAGVDPDEETWGLLSLLEASVGHPGLLDACIRLWSTPSHPKEGDPSPSPPAPPRDYRQSNTVIRERIANDLQAGEYERVISTFMKFWTGSQGSSNRPDIPTLRMAMYALLAHCDNFASAFMELLPPVQRDPLGVKPLLWPDTGVTASLDLRDFCWMAPLRVARQDLDGLFLLLHVTLRNWTYNRTSILAAVMPLLETMIQLGHPFWLWDTAYCLKMVMAKDVPLFPLHQPLMLVSRQHRNSVDFPLMLALARYSEDIGSFHLSPPRLKNLYHLLIAASHLKRQEDFDSLFALYRKDSLFLDTDICCAALRMALHRRNATEVNQWLRRLQHDPFLKSSQESVELQVCALYFLGNE